jgi:mercuric ion binding protein
MKTLYTMLAALLLLFSNPAYARVSSLSVEVNGMACPFCAFGVEKRLKTVTGVASASVDMKTGKAFVTAMPELSIDYENVPQAVKDAGFTAGDMLITVEGLVSKNTQHALVLQFNGISLPLQIEINELNAQLNTAAEKGETVVLNGRIFLSRDKKWTFRPEVVKEIEL